MTTMDVQMMQAQRATRGRTPGHARNGSAGAAAPSWIGEPALEEAAQRANAGPHAASLAGLQSVVAQRACADCEHVRRAMGGGTVQRAVADDVAAMGLQADFQAMLARSAKARALVARADALGVQVARGGSHAQTVRTQGGGLLRVTVPAGETGRTALQSVFFELQNAVRYDRLEALTARAASGDIADEDEFAREKIKIELAGMIATVEIANEHNQSPEARQAGDAIPYSGFFIPTFADSFLKRREDPSLTRERYAASMADAVLDQPHGQGSHRAVYRNQFRALANPGNREARERNARTRARAEQLSAMSKLIGPGPAVEKLWRETSEGPEVAAWLERHRESAPWGELDAATRAERLRAELAHGDGEAAIGRMGREAAAALYAWIERNDEGRYRNLAQALGLSLGYYDRAPQQLTHGIYGR